jgi:hypothetical protein
MPITVLLSPMLFLKAGKALATGDDTMGFTMLGVGTLFILTGIFECNFKNK